VKRGGRNQRARTEGWIGKIIVLLWGVGVIGTVTWCWPLPPAPTFRETVAAYRPSEVLVLDRTGAIIQERRVDLSGRRFAWTPLEEISPAVLEVVVASEDRRFYQHGGVDWQALGGVILRRLTGRPLRGASTITMQVASLLEPARPTRTKIARSGSFFSLLSYKWRQMRRAWALEKSWTKAEILEAYLNLAPFRGEVEGISAASFLFFNKAPHGITEAEATALVVMLQAPNAPPEALLKRARLFLEKHNTSALREEVAKAVELTVHASSQRLSSSSSRATFGSAFGF